MGKIEKERDRMGNKRKGGKTRENNVEAEISRKRF